MTMEPSEETELPPMEENPSLPPEALAGPVEKLPPPLSPLSKNFLDKIETESSFEVRLGKILEQLGTLLSDPKSDHFRSFWELRRVCIDLLKQLPPTPDQGSYWTDVSRLTEEAKRLKALSDQEMQLATHQIEAAISALERDCLDLPQAMEQLPLPEFNPPRDCLQNGPEVYRLLQAKLSFLSSRATLIQSVRKELIKTKMRVRTKNLFFQRLSSLGDRVFPLRKTLIRELSFLYENDIRNYASERFQKNLGKAPHQQLRDEVKALQATSKYLTINTHSFNVCREILTKCWEEIKEVVREWKKERVEKKKQSEQYAEQFSLELKSLERTIEAKKLSPKEALHLIDKKQQALKKLDCLREEKTALAANLDAIRKPIYEKVQREEQADYEKLQQSQKLRKSSQDKIREEIDQLLEEAPTIDGALLEERKLAVEKNLDHSSLPAAEKNRLARSLFALEEIILAKKEAVSGGEEDLDALLQKHLSYQESILRLIKECRQSITSSGAGFSEALALHERERQAVQQLERERQAIANLRSKIDQRRSP